MNFSLMGNLLNWQRWGLCLGKAPVGGKKKPHIFKKKHAWL